MQLRELNELNFARFDAKLEQRIDHVSATLREEMALLRTEVHQEIGKLRVEMATLRSDVKQETAELRGEILSLRTLVRWLFGFWAASTVTILAAIIRLGGF